jgi:hypothetical protein
MIFTQIASTLLVISHGHAVPLRGSRTIVHCSHGSAHPRYLPVFCVHVLSDSALQRNVLGPLCGSTVWLWAKITTRRTEPHWPAQGLVTLVW